MPKKYQRNTTEIHNLNMITIADVIKYLDETFHPEYQENYDNAGFLVGDGAKEYRGSLVALDLTEEVADEALAMGLNLIVTHHPFIFRGVKRITNHDDIGRLIMKLILSGTAVYAAHTNLDNLPDGVNGILSEKLELLNCRILKPFESNNTLGAGMVGELAAPMTTETLLLKVKTLTGLPTVRYAGGSGVVHRVALCGGSGAEFIGDALASGADIYLTADLKYHDFQRSTERMALADIGHYESEQFAKEIICHTILKKFSNFACRISERQGSLVSYI